MDRKDMLIAASAGFLMMVLEVTGARLLYPHFGSSMVIWASIIGMFMVVLSCGYYLGGKLSRQSDAASKVSLYLAAGGIITIVLPFLAPALGALPIPWQLRLLISAAAISLPALGLSIVTPVLVGRSKRTKAGESAGTVYAVSTAGSIIGTFASAFLLLPYLGAASTAGITGALMVLLAVLFDGKKLGHFLMASCVAVAYLITPAFGTPTYFYTAQVEDNRGVRYLFLDSWPSSALNLSNYPDPVFDYTKKMKQGMARIKDAKSVAIIGAGGCTQVHSARELFPDADISVVDIDAKLFDICREQFAVSEDSKTHFFTQDGRKFLEEHSPFDMIVVDAFSSGCHLPSHIASSEFFKTASNSLSVGGILLANVIVRTDSGSGEVICNTVRSAFSSVECEYLSKGFTNMVISASGRGASVSSGEIITDDRNPIEVSYGFECRR